MVISWLKCATGALLISAHRIYARARVLRVLWWIRIYECPRGCHSVQPYTVYTPSARFIFFGFFGFVQYHIIETLSLTTDRAMALLPPPERPPAYEYGARSEMVLPASMVLRGVEEQSRWDTLNIEKLWVNDVSDSTIFTTKNEENVELLIFTPDWKV